MSVSDTIQVTTVVRDSAPAVSDYGTPLILAFHDNFVGVQEYAASASGLAAMVAAGFSTSSDAYKQASAIVSQNPHTDAFKVGTRAAHNVQAIELTPAYTTAGKVVSFSLEYEGTTHLVTYTIVALDAAADIVTGLIASLGVVSGLTIGGTDTMTIALTAGTDGERFYYRSVVGLGIEDTSADAGIAADLATTVADDDDWYGLLIDSQSALEIAAAATWAAANKKIFGAQSPDAANLVADTGVAYTLQQATNNYTYAFASRDTLGCGAAALMGRQFSRSPGSSTWAHKTLTGPVPDAYTGTEFSAARANGALTYVTDAGWIHTYDGAACGGRFLDITRGIDWLESMIVAAILAVYANSEKVPYTDAGSALFEAALGGALGAAEDAGLLAPGWTIVRPKVAAQSAADKAARHFPNLTWSGELQGAVHSAAIDGEVIV